MSGRSTSKLSKFLVSPNRLASILDWKKASGGTIMSLDISKECVGLAIGRHPEAQEEEEEDCRDQGWTLALHNNRWTRELEMLVKENSVCGFVVGWPVQENGRVGASCGKVLYELDSLHYSTLFHNRPFTLYGGTLPTTTAIPDMFGRSVCFSQVTSTSTYIHTTFSHRESSSSSAASLLQQFLASHWPTITTNTHPQQPASPNKSLVVQPKQQRFQKLQKQPQEHPLQTIQKTLSAIQPPPVQLDDMEANQILSQSLL